MKDILSGALVRLSALDPEEFSKAFTQWRRDSEFMRLMDGGPISIASQKNAQKWFEKDVEEPEAHQHVFAIRTLADDKLIGDIGLYVVNWPGRDAFVGLGIGERDFWGKGYGTDLMKLILGYAFLEVNLRRVTLTVFEYNPRAIRAYEKAGFRHEGRIRGGLHRDGKRYDELFMGVLREEWLEQNMENQ